jgi:hypothetical protein
MLTSILDAEITTRVIRLGSRTKDERIAQYSLHKLEQLSRCRDLNWQKRRERRTLQQVEEDMTRILNRIQRPHLTWEHAKRYLDFHYPQHADSLRDSPFWIAELFQWVTEDENENGEWIEVSSGWGKQATQGPQIAGIYGFWKNGRDLAFIQPLGGAGHEMADPRQAFFNDLGFFGQMPPVPSGRRPLERLIESTGSVWSMSLSERQCLARSWEDDMRKIAYESNIEEFVHLKEQYKDACGVYEDVQDEVSRFEDVLCE